MAQHRSICRHIAAIVLAGAAAYLSALGGDFVFDDRAYIAENPWIRSLGNLAVPAGLRYVGDLSFALNYALAGPDPFWFHLVNIAIHLAGSALLFLLILEVMRTPALSRFAGGDGKAGLNAAFWTAALFAVHPVQTQAVTYISQRYTCLAALFYLAAVLLYLRGRAVGQGQEGGARPAYLLAAFLAALAAVKTKEISFTLPFMLLLAELALLKGRPLARALWLAPFFVAAALIPAGLFMEGASGNPIEEMMRGRKLDEAFGISRYEYLLTQLTVVVEYIRLIFIPAGQRFIYGVELEKSLLEPRVLLSGAALAALLAGSLWQAIRSVRKGHALAFLASSGVVWFFVTISVESSFLPIKDAMNEHRLYLPSAGLLLSVVACVLLASERAGRQRLAAAGLAVVVVALGAATASRNLVWSDPVRLYSNEVRLSPASSGARMYLGIELYRRGYKAEALSEFEKAESLNPSSGHVLRSIARFHYNEGDLDKAIAATERLLRHDADNLEQRYNLGVLYYKKGFDGKAEAVFRGLLGGSQWQRAAQALKKMESEGRAGLKGD